MTVKGIFFDLYGTLFIYGDMKAELAEYLTEYHARLKKHGLLLSRDSFADYWERYLSKAEAPARDGLTSFERRIQAGCSDLRLDIPISAIKDTATALLEIWDRYVSLDPECLAVLETLARRKYRTPGLISNFDHPPHTHALVRKFGLDKLLDPVIVSGDIGIKKPDPRIFHLALRQTGLEPEDAIYVGDSEEDIVGAINAGMTPVLIDRAGRGNNWGQAHTISSLRDILDLR